MFKIIQRRNLLSVIGVFICCYLLFMMPYAVSSGITNGLEICFHTILPSLFPFMVLSSYIIKTDTFSSVYGALSPLTRFLFKQPDCAVAVIIMGLIGGFPVGAKMTAMLFEEGKISKNEAQRLCMFCVNGGPAFIITAIGIGMFGSNKAGVIMFISLCVSSIVIGIISRFFGDKNRREVKHKSNGQNPLLALSSSVSDNVNSILSICAWIILFSAVTECIKELKLNDNIYTALVSVLEVTKGCAQIAEKMPIEIVTGVIGFGGFCVHCQVYSFVRTTGLKYIRFFTGRVINGALSAVICHLLLMAFPVDLETGLQNVSGVAPFSVSLPAFISVFVMCIIMIFDIDSKRKVC